jgi:hypothetical protein
VSRVESGVGEPLAGSPSESCDWLKQPIPLGPVLPP